jgi:uncharacterized protein
MARPRKRRLIACEVNATYFKPQGIPMRYLEEIELGMDELEAIRLADLEGLYHANAALKMGVSRPTFGNIIARTRTKIATALLQGKALRINATSEGVQLPQTPPTDQPDLSNKGEPMKPLNPAAQGNEAASTTEQVQQKPAQGHCGCGQHANEPGHTCCGGGHNHQHGHGHSGECCGGGGGRCGRS